MGRKELFRACGLDGNPDVKELKELLKRNDIDFNEGGMEYGLMTPLEVACRNGYLEIVEVLLEDPRVLGNYSCMSGISPFYTVCKVGHLEIVKYLLMNEMIVIDFTELKDNVFLDACCLKQIDVGKWILASGRKIPKEIIELTKNSLEKLRDNNWEFVRFVRLLEEFLLDPIQTRKELRKGLGLPGLIFLFLLS